MKGERGFALVLTLIVTALLVALVTEFINETYVDASHSHNFVASQQSSVLAESGAALGRSLLELQGSQSQGYTSLLDPWAQPLQWSDETGTLTITIEEESGKLNLNNLLYSGLDNPYAFQKAARNLFLSLKLPADLCDTAIDWISAADKPPQTNGAKSPYYNALKPPYNVKGDKFDTVEELCLVKGFTPEIVAKLKHFVTVYPRNGMGNKINVNTAPPEVLTSIDGMTTDMASSIIDYRKTQPIKALSDIPGLKSPSPALLSTINFGGSVYRIHAEGKVGESVSVVEVVYSIPDKTILYWREY